MSRQVVDEVVEVLQRFFLRVEEDRAGQSDTEPPAITRSVPLELPVASNVIVRSDDSVAATEGKPLSVPWSNIFGWRDLDVRKLVASQNSTNRCFYNETTLPGA